VNYAFKQPDIPTANLRKTEGNATKLRSAKPEVKEFKELSELEYKQVFDDYYESIRSFVYFKAGDAGLAEDIAQDTFFKLWETRDRIALSTVKSYLYTIAGNLTINQLKRQQLKYKLHQQVKPATDIKDPHYLAEMKEYEEKLNGVINGMTEASREVFLMNRMEGLKYREIAERLGITVKAVEKRMSKALTYVKQNLGVSI